MSNSYFQFKQFTIFQDKCAMKVGTDGVLLGAWANITSARTILDVGTGTGLIALMLAQRNLRAKITAIDVDKNAVEQATENVRNAIFSDRITVKEISFQKLALTDNTQFDAIVSNPPYFADSLLPPDKQRSQARHAVSLSLEELLDNAKTCLAENGRLSLILPVDRESELQNIAYEKEFYIHRKTMVKPLPHNPPKRMLVELSEKQSKTLLSELVIEEARHRYTADFIALVKDFYLNL